ncbi:MAG TPA: efflux RND transporter periplasmic adaptor subunit [Pyrinomonadaceae bacterium]|nr:efflux RND transporter periplasmic adaptor subunit [Pyrinomonadaceae bacterium]
MSCVEPRLGLTLLLAGSLLTGCTAGSKTLAPDNRSSANSSTNRKPFRVHIFNAQPSTSTGGGDRLIPAALSVEGTAIALAERAGRIVKLSGSEGARIRKGEVLARFDDDDQQTQLRQAEIEVSRLKVEEQQYDALLKLRRSELEREQRLAKDGVSSMVNVEQAQYRLEQANHENEKARLASATGLAKVKAAQIEVEKSTVRAPIAGVIIHRYATLGSSVAQNDKLFEVSKLSPLEVRFQLPQNENRKLHPAEILDLSAVDSDLIIARARIRRIDPVADATSNTFGYLADVISGSGLMPGLAVNVHLPRAGDAISFWIPRAAFPAGTDLRSNTSATLFIANGTKADARLVLIHSIEGDQIEIVSGLSPNDSLILSPPAELKDQDPIEISD